MKGIVKGPQGPVMCRIHKRLKKGCCTGGVNNGFYGRKHKVETIKKLSDMRKGKLNPLWKGDAIGKGPSLHEWIRSHKPKPKYCEERTCENEPYDLANISQKYHRNINDFEWLCRSCHMRKDGRLEKLYKARWGSVSI